jgi:acyl-CoA-binding protein
MPRVRVRVRRRRTVQESQAARDASASKQVAPGVEALKQNKSEVKNVAENRSVNPSVNVTVTPNLDELFTAGVAFSGSAEAKSGPSLTTGQQLTFYGLFKQATCGQCKSRPPSRLSVVARRKWQAWKELGDMPCEEAKRGYVRELDRLQPAWRVSLSGLRSKL